MPRDPLPDRIRQARDARQLTQVQLAERAGLPPATISHFETGIRTPGTSTLRRLADALEVTVDYLLGRAEPTPSGPDAEVIFRNLTGLSTRSLEEIRRMTEALKKLDEKDNQG